MSNSDRQRPAQHGTGAARKAAQAGAFGPQATLIPALPSTSDTDRSMSRLPQLATLAGLLMLVRVACACEADATPIFGCEAADGHKFIELCAATTTNGANGYLQYRFGSLNSQGQEQTVELEFPAKRASSARQFFGATYTSHGIYTQSVRFVSGKYSYTIYTRAKGSRALGSGVEVRNQVTGQKVAIDCSERPRFYIFELKGVIACDPETPVGHACIQ